jgi:pSer/pThr/pTyr-binding forkhead associated (FHA) protein
MWSLRALNGSVQGQVFPLKAGRNLLGRASHCEVSIPSSGISKEHLEIHVYPEKLILVDLKSSNGTFLNGIKIQSANIRLGDKVQVHDIIFDLMPTQEPKKRHPKPAVRRPQQLNSMGSAAPQLTPFPNHMPEMVAQQQQDRKTPQHLQNQNIVESLINQSQDYMEKVALPGIYKLGEWFEFRWVIALFVILFVFSVTLLAMIPTYRSARESVLGESMRRAQSVARHLAEINQKLLLEGQLGNLSTHTAELEEGVKEVFIVQKTDGAILAPASKAGRIADQSFVHKARTEDRPITAEIGATLIGASAPIGQFDPATGLPSVKAYAIVIYDVSGMVLDESRALSLFMQILVLAGLIGSILYYLLVKFVEKPIKELNFHLDTAMRDRSENITIPYLYPDLQALIGNMNSLLSRSLQVESSGNEKVMSSTNKMQEAQSLVAVSSGPSLAIGSDEVIWAMNEAFTKLIGQNSTGDSYKNIPDTPLQQNLESLMMKAKENPYTSHFDTLEFSGHMCQIQILSLHTNGHTDYFFVTVKPQGGDG